MKPLSLRLADRDIKAFEVLIKAPEVHLTVACFHAQQAVEKSLKAALFSHEIEFGRTHDLTQLTYLLRGKGISVPVPDDDLRRLNPFAVTFRYDEMEFEIIPKEDAVNIITIIRDWAEKVIESVRIREDQGPEA